MPPLPPIPLVLKLQLQFDNSIAGTSPLNKGYNILHLQYSGGGGWLPSDLVAVANGAMTWWGTHFKAQQSTGWRLAQVLCTALDGSGTFGFSTSAAIAGTMVGSLPPQCSPAISWLGAPSYRGGKPRTYFVGPGAAAAINYSSALSPSFCTTLQANAVAAIADMTPMMAGTFTPVLGTVSYISKTLNPVPPYHRATPLFWKYTGAHVHNRMDSQRRRSGKESSFAVT